MAWCRVLLVQEVVVLAIMIAGTHGWVVHLPRATSTDFASFYAAGHLANAGTPELVYDRAAHMAAEQAVTEPGIQYNYFFYPPVFLLICAPLARLPYLVAFILFEAATLLGYLAVARRILQPRGWAWLVPVVAFPAVFWNAGIGQNAFLSAALFGVLTLCLDRRPWSAGAAAGLVCFKPHFGLLLPVAFAMQRNWRAFTMAAAVALALVGLSVGLYGVETWRGYLLAFRDSKQVYETGQIGFRAFVTPFGGARLVGLPPAASYAVQVVCSVVVMGAVGWMFRRDARLPLRAAALCAGTLVAVPLALFYDLMLVAVAMAWLVQDGRTHPLGQGERMVLAVVYLLAMLGPQAGHIVPVPLGMGAPLLLLALCLRRAVPARMEAVARA